MKKRFQITILLALIAGLASPVDAIEVVNKEDVGLNIGGRAQVYGFAQYVNDSVRNDARLYLFLKQARLNLSGRYKPVKYYLELAFAGEEEVRAPNPGVSLNLLDLYFDIPVWKEMSLRIGQFKIPYSRERLVNSEAMQFADRSIDNLAFQFGRDVGGALYGRHGNMEAAFGVFTGGGRDQPQRFLPQNLGFPLLVLRAGYDTGVDQDIFTIQQNTLEPDGTKYAALVNALYMKDSIIGHSTVLNVKTAEKSLLLNSNWNPFISQAPLDKGNLWQGGFDLALRKPLGAYSLSAEAEGNYGRYSNAYGKVDLFGGRTQIGIYRKPFEVSVRYAVIRPDANFANGGASVTGTGLIHEVTPGATYYFKGHQMKLIVDAPLLINVPVVTEPAVGAYVLTEQPDQASVLNPTRTGGPGTVVRQFVPEGRILFQAGF